MSMSDFLRFKNEVIAAKEKEKKYAVIGCPVKHSMSPKMHGCLVKNIMYSSVEIAGEQLSDFCEFAKYNLNGFNVTIPYKQEIINHLDHIDDFAKEIGSVNTVKVENNKLYGYNTDVYGITQTLATENIEPKDAKALVLGAGGAAIAAVYALNECGCKVTVAARNERKARQNLKGSYEFADINTVSGSYDIVVNCTPCGMMGQENEVALDIFKLKNVKLVFDTIYNPLKTKLLKQAENQGIMTVNGLKMLVYQGIKAQRIWGNKIFNICDSQLLNVLRGEVFSQRLQSIYGKKAIAFCGFMGSGKTTLSKVLCRKYGKKYVDTDVLIGTLARDTISNIFKEHGEEYFRQLETKTLKNINYDEINILSLGGGAVVKPENVEILKENCLIIYIETLLETSLERASRKGERPLLKKSHEEVQALYSSRREIYQKVCDIVINGEEDIDTVALSVLESI